VTVEYSITPLGTTLAAVVGELTKWADENVEAILKARKRYEHGVQKVRS
jgi:DNA-binding HxlR family transcriptional regulator